MRGRLKPFQDKSIRFVLCRYVLAAYSTKNLQVLKHACKSLTNFKCNIFLSPPEQLTSATNPVSFHTYTHFPNKRTRLSTSYRISVSPDRHLSTYSYSNALCEDISVRIRNKDLTPDSLPFWINKISSSVYDKFEFHIRCEDQDNRNKQILYNIYHKDLKYMFTNNPHFQHVLENVQLNLLNIDVRSYPVLLNSLTMLISEKHPLCQKLQLICEDNLHHFPLSDIAILLKSYNSCAFNGLKMKSKVLELVKNGSLQGFISDPHSLGVFCDIFRQTGHIVSKETFKKGANLAMTSMVDDLLLRDPVNTLNAFSKFPITLWGKLDLALENLNFDLTDLDVDTCLFLASDLDPVLGRPIMRKKRWKSFQKYLEGDIDNTNPLELLKLCLLFYSTKSSYYNIMSTMFGRDYLKQESRLLHQLSRLTDCCDTFWLIQDWFKTVSNPSKLRDLVKRIVGLVYRNPSSYKAIAASVMQQIMDDVKLGHLLCPEDAEFILKSINMMDTHSLNYSSSVIDPAKFKGSSYNSHVRKIMKKLHERMTEAFQDKLSSVSFLPTICHTPTSIPVSLSDQQIASLSALTSTLEEDKCLRAITVLGNISWYPQYYFLPEIFENLLQFTYTQKGIPFHSFLSLVKVIASAGYQPEDFLRFKDCFIKFHYEVLQSNRMKSLDQLQMMYYAGLLEIYDTINLYLSMDTLLAVDREINSLKVFKPGSAAYYKTCLFRLIRNVVIECPYLCLQQFVHVKPIYSKVNVRELNRLYESVKRIFEDSPLVSTASCSQYGHHIDALVSLDWDGFAYQLKEPHSKEDFSHSYSHGIDSYRLALLYFNKRQFCVQSDELTGIEKANIRQLQLLGYTVVQLPYTRLGMMDLQSDQALDGFLKTRIQSELGIDGMFDK